MPSSPSQRPSPSGWCGSWGSEEGGAPGADVAAVGSPSGPRPTAEMALAARLQVE